MPLILAPHGAPPDLRTRLASLRRRLRRAATIHGTSAAAALGLATLITVGLLALYPDAAGIAAVRLADPFGAHPWPLQTQLELTAPTWIARGDPFVLRGELHGVIPDRVSFTFALDGAPANEQPMAVTPAA